MNLRVTVLTQNDNAVANIRARSAELAKFQSQVTSGLRVQRASDDPRAFPSLVEAKAATNRLATYEITVGDASTTLGNVEGVLQDTNNALVRAKQIALEGADSTTDPASREALAAEVDGLLDRVLQAANSRPDGSALFAGTATATAPFRVATRDAQGRPATIAYDGATEAARVVTGRGTTVDTRLVGSEVFQQTGGDVFATLISLRDTLRGSVPLPPGTTFSAAMTQRIADVDAARTALSSTVGEQASSTATLEGLKNLIADSKLDFTARAGELEGTDFAQAVVKMQEQQTALQAIYAVTARLSDPGLLDFIR
jgi:flagellar hook-associated protein 3 FlgL